MDDFKVIAFTHKNLPLELVGKLHLESEDQSTVLGALKLNFGFEEFLFLSTCNRVELLIKAGFDINPVIIKEMCLFINSRLSNFEADTLSEKAEVYYGEEGVEHVLRVASSLDSLVVGEREIITQVRKAYDFCNQMGITGDFMRLLVKQTIETAKEVYTNTNIAKNPVSVVSLAYRQLKDMGIKDNARMVFVGSGVSNTAMAGYMKKHRFANFSVFNRTLANAEKLAGSLNGKAYPLTELENYEKGFDALIVCTASATPVITPKNYSRLVGADTGKKIIIDLGIPANVDREVLNQHKISYINIGSLKEQAEKNLQLRRNEIERCEEIIKAKTRQFKHLHHERRIELAFGDVPKQVRCIKDLALNEVFAKEISSLDSQGREVLDKVISYMEKKYNAVAIKTAKSVLLNSKD